MPIKTPKVLFLKQNFLLYGRLDLIKDLELFGEKDCGRVLEILIKDC
jgi:hypothetical protein